MVELHVTPALRSAEDRDIESDVVDRDWLGRELGRLDLDQRAVMVLHFYADLTLQQAADVLEIPVGTAKSRLHYGLRALRESMTDGEAGRRGERIA